MYFSNSFIYLVIFIGDGSLITATGINKIIKDKKRAWRVGTKFKSLLENLHTRV